MTKRKVVELEDVLGLMPFPCETTVVSIDPEACVVRVWSCPSYLACLDAACANNWRGFTCRACPVYHRYFNAVRVRIVRKVIIHD